MSLSREELEKRLQQYGCRFRADMGAGLDMWLTEWGLPFFLQRGDDGRYSDAEYNEVALFVYREQPFDWWVQKEFRKVWGSVSAIEQDIGRLRGELRRR